MTEVFILLGSNLDDPSLQLEQAKKQLESRAGKLIRRSAVYWSAPWGKEDQPAFLNQVVELSTPLSPVELLACLLSIEESMGRKRLVKWGSRTIDLDLLYYGKEIITTPSLKVPHPEIANRRFVLEPLCEIAASFVHPVLNVANEKLLERCEDRLEVKMVSSER